MSTKKDSDAPGAVSKPLEGVFREVVAEARSNPDFAKRLRDALDEKPVRTASKGSRQAAGTRPDLHAVNILRQHGEQMLRGRLSSLRTKSDLQYVAKRSGLRLTGSAAKKTATRPELIEGIVAAAQQYNSQRQATDG